MYAAFFYLEKVEKNKKKVKNVRKTFLSHYGGPCCLMNNGLFGRA